MLSFSVRLITPCALCSSLLRGCLGDTTSNCCREFRSNWSTLSLSPMTTCMHMHLVIFCVNVSAFECSFWSTLKNGKFRRWTEPTVWSQPRYRICRGWILSLVEIIFPLFFCVVIDGNKVCVKKIFPNEVQSAVKYHFGSLRIDGRLGLLASVLQSFYLYSHHLTTFSV